MTPTPAQRSDPTPTRSKITRIGLWTLAALVAVFFAAGALTKVTGSPEMLDAFQAWGYPAWFAYLVGATELLGATLLMIPHRNVKGASLRFHGALLLTVILLGAIGTHIVHAEYLEALVPLALLVPVLSLAATAKPRRPLTEA